MQHLFTPEAINEISQKISKSLIDTFRLMFALDVQYLPAPLDEEHARQVHAHIKVKGEQFGAVMAVSVNRAVLDSIINAVEDTSPQHYDEAAADIVREICNIVGNQLRAYMSDAMGKSTTLSLPVDGPFIASEPNENLFLLHFKIEKQDSLSIGLHTTEA